MRLRTPSFRESVFLPRIFRFAKKDGSSFLPSLMCVFPVPVCRNKHNIMDVYTYMYMYMHVYNVHHLHYTQNIPVTPLLAACPSLILVGRGESGRF